MLLKNLISKANFTSSILKVSCVSKCKFAFVEGPLFKCFPFLPKLVKVLHTIFDLLLFFNFFKKNLLKWNQIQDFLKKFPFKIVCAHVHAV